jgi:hypothetical protein
MGKLMKILPIGTCRLHEMLEILHQENQHLLPAFLGIGYFHTSSQVLQCLELLKGARNISPQQYWMFFREDKTPLNNFRADIIKNWKENSQINFALDNFAEFDALIIEISASKNFLYDGLYVQGNPNFVQNASYQEVWREGYYHHYCPELKVQPYTQHEQEIYADLLSIASIFAGKKIFVMPHLSSHINPNKTRKELYDILERICAKHEGLQFVDTSPYVDKFGYKKDANGVEDIHHLGKEALTAMANDFAKMLQN